MNNWVKVLLVGAMLVSQLSAFAENRSVTIEFSSEKKGLDSYAVHSARKIIGTALAEGIVDSVSVAGPSTPPTPGFSACIDAGINSTAKSFDTFVKKLKFIHPKLGTTLNVALTNSCKKSEEFIACGGITGKLCPDNLICIDDPRDTCDPIQGGKDCMGICNTQ